MDIKEKNSKILNYKFNYTHNINKLFTSYKYNVDDTIIQSILKEW
uniref:Uncharacterized protein n=1 Tax=viral metagenome TaxID=1070528 RepID=A0A6C0AZB9_9ZZZZ